MVRLYPLLLLAVLLTSCLAPATAQKNKKTPRPAWLDKRPNDANFYVGIGSSSITKNPGNYQEAARLVALNDLSGEIVVNISGETDFTERETNGEVEELYQSTIKSITENNLEGYEQVDTYTDGDLFWAYYRISKQKYLANKRKRFSEAMANSDDLYNRAAGEESAGRIYPAFLLYTQSLEPLLPYLISALEPEFKGKATEQNNKLTGALIKLMSGLRFESAAGEVTYKLGSKKDLKIPIKVTYNADGKSIPVERLPVQFTFGPGNGTFQSEFVNSDANGLATAVVTRIEPTKRSVVVKATFNTADFEVLFDKRVSLFTLGDVAPPSARVRIKTQGPRVLVESTEKSLGVTLTQNVLQPVVTDFLIENGCTIVGPDDEYDFIVEIKAETRKGTTAGRAHQALLNANIVALDGETEDEIVNLIFQDLKGVKFDFENASRDAYSKARKKMEEEFLPQFLDKLYN